MAHHGSSPFDPMRDPELRELLLGPTKQFPEGKLTQRDEGEIRVAIGQHEGKVVIDFGKPVAWLGFTAEQADDIANSLRDHARECRLRR